MNKNHRVGVAVATDWHRLKGGTAVRRCAQHECASPANNMMTALSQPWPILRQTTLVAVALPWPPSSVTQRQHFLNVKSINDFKILKLVCVS